MRLPNPNDFRSPDEFISAVESLGRSMGAKAVGPACIGLPHREQAPLRLVL